LMGSKKVSFFLYFLICCIKLVNSAATMELFCGFKDIWLK
jgi:hypothetical protein